MRKASKQARRREAARPSPRSLRAMPERRADAKAKAKVNKFAAGIAQDGGLAYQVDGKPVRWMPLPQGRPKKGELVEPSTPRTVRLPDSVWTELGTRAKARGVGAHTLLRELVSAYLSNRPRSRLVPRSKRIGTTALKGVRTHRA